MNSPLLIGIGAGLASALLFASSTTGMGLALVLFYVTALPGFTAGLGWGTQGAVVSGVTGTGVVALLAGPLAGAGYFLTLGLPIAILCHFALLARPVDEEQAGAKAGGGALEWYPPGRIVAWTALMAGGVSALSVPVFGTDVETYRANLQELLDKAFFSQIPEGEALDKEKMAPFIDFIVRTLPAASAIVWFLVMLLNMWTGAKIVDMSSRSIRPWPDLTRMNYPGPFALGFAAALIATFLPGILRIVATGFVGAFLVAYVLLGLIVLHTMARTSPYRVLLLGTLYLGIFLFGWVALLVALVGIGEPVFRLRERALNNRGGPPPDDD